MKTVDREALCRRYFIIGFFGLPFLWLINAIWFGNFIFIQKGEPKRTGGQKRAGAPMNGTVGGGGNTREVASNVAAPTASSSSSSASSTSRQRTFAAGQALPDADAAPPNHQPTAQQQPQQEEEDAETKQRSLQKMKLYVILSAFGVLVWAAVLITWIVIFQTKRAEWGEFGDEISFNIPRGIP